MKRILCASAVIFAFFELVYFSYAANAPANIGYVALAVSSGTATDIMASIAPAVGYIRYCTNCAGGGNAGTICISTGSTTAAQFVLSTGTRCQ